jgi:hypothetical protein
MTMITLTINRDHLIPVVNALSYKAAGLAKGSPERTRLDAAQRAIYDAFLATQREKMKETT